jgi:AbrB family looped-hinge helix DNA binding protein
MLKWYILLPGDVIGMNTSTVSAKGWVVIPQELRGRYGLKKGDKVHFVEYGGVIAVVPVSNNAIEETKGMLKGQTSLVEALFNSRREDAAKGK